MAVGLVVSSSFADDAAIFTFSNNDNLDGAGPGVSSEVVVDDASLIGVAITTVDVIGISTGDVGSPTTSALNTSDTHETNIGTSTESLGINSDGNGGYSSDATNFNPGEAWVFNFNSDVTLTSIDFASFDDDGIGMTVSSSAFASFDIDFGDLNGAGAYSFGDLPVSAGTSITFLATGPAADVDPDPNFRISNIVVILLS